MSYKEGMSLRTTRGMLCAMFPFALALAGCAEVVGIEDFTVSEASSSTGPLVDACTEVHGCTRVMATDYTQIPGDEVGVSFDATGYDPRCIRVRSGTKVIFNSSSTFAEFPIVGGIYPNEDSTSQIQPPDPNAMVATFQLSGRCSFPYFSRTNGAVLNGAVFISTQ